SNARSPSLCRGDCSSLLWVIFDDQVDQAPVLRLFRRHEEVAFHRAFHVLDLPLAVLGVDARDLLALAKDLLGVDLDVRRLALDALGERLVDEDLGVGQGHAHARVAARKKDRRAARGETRAQRGDLGTDVLHRVVYRQRRGERSARAVVVDLDVLLGSLVLQEQELRGHGARHVVVDDAAHEDDAVPEETRIDVVSPFAASIVGDHGRYEMHWTTSCAKSRWGLWVWAVGLPSPGRR